MKSFDGIRVTALAVLGLALFEIGDTLASPVNLQKRQSSGSAAASSLPTASPVETLRTEWLFGDFPEETTTEAAETKTATPLGYLAYTGASFSDGGENTTIYATYPLTITDYAQYDESVITVTATSRCIPAQRIPTLTDLETTRDIAVAGASYVSQEWLYVEADGESISENFYCSLNDQTKGVCEYGYAWGENRDERTTETVTLNATQLTYTAILTSISIPQGMSDVTAIAALALPTAAPVATQSGVSAPTGVPTALTRPASTTAS